MLHLKYGKVKRTPVPSILLWRSQKEGGREKWSPWQFCPVDSPRPDLVFQAKFAVIQDVFNGHDLKSFNLICVYCNAQKPVLSNPSCDYPRPVLGFKHLRNLLSVNRPSSNDNFYFESFYGYTHVNEQLS